MILVGCVVCGMRMSTTGDTNHPEELGWRHPRPEDSAKHEVSPPFVPMVCPKCVQRRKAATR